MEFNLCALAQAAESSFFEEHFDALVTVVITILGFIITYYMTKKNFKDEVIKNKLAVNADAIKDLPYDVCQLMDRIIPKGNQKPLTVDDFSNLHSRILAYGSKDAVAIAIQMQQLCYNNNQGKDQDKNWETLACYALLLTQIKLDLTSEIISPESWFKLKINDYYSIRPKMVDLINKNIDNLCLNKNFKVKEVK